MNIKWGGFAENVAASEGQHLAGREQSSIEVTGYETNVISPPDDSGIALIETPLTERFSGGLVGDGRAGHVRVVLPDGTSTFTGVERFIGTLNDRSGSFALTASGYTDAEGIVHGRWRVVEDSGTDQLAGLRGYGEFTAVAEAGAWHARDTFTYWFEL
jgi:hypothetical protein